MVQWAEVAVSPWSPRGLRTAGGESLGRPSAGGPAVREPAPGTGPRPRPPRPRSPALTLSPCPLRVPPISLLTVTSNGYVLEYPRFFN